MLPLFLRSMVFNTSYDRCKGAIAGKQKGNTDMTPKDVELIQANWAKVEPLATDVARLFYGKLFELDSSLKPLFKGDMVEQGGKLTSLLGTVVKELNNLEAMVPAVEALGKRHVAYQVEPQHYDTVGEALLWTLEKGLGADFTDEARAAWTEAYFTLSTVMKQAAYGELQEAAAK